jgi:hypothetical protein
VLINSIDTVCQSEPDSCHSAQRMGGGDKLDQNPSTYSVYACVRACVCAGVYARLWLSDMACSYKMIDQTSFDAGKI